MRKPQEITRLDVKKYVYDEDEDDEDDEDSDSDSSSSDGWIVSTSTEPDSSEGSNGKEDGEVWLNLWFEGFSRTVEPETLIEVTFTLKTLSYAIIKQTHSFKHSYDSSGTRWGYERVISKTDLWKNNPEVKRDDAFLLTVCACVVPRLPSVMQASSATSELVARSLFQLEDDRDVEFRLFYKRPRRNAQEPSCVQPLYASSRILRKACQYFSFRQSRLASRRPVQYPSPPSR